jgi:uncharacterized protein YkwD
MFQKNVPRYILLGIICLFLWQFFPTGNILQGEEVVKTAKASKVDFAGLENEIAEKINAKREAAGLNSLAISPHLNRTAQEKSQDMAQKKYFSHENKQGKMIWDSIKANGYRFRYAGENLARNFDDSTSVVEAWMKSESHRKNILFENFTDLGIGIGINSQNDNEGIYITTIFAKPQS